MSFVCVSASTKSSMSQGWELIKEKKKIRKQENKHSFKKKELVQEDKDSVKKTRSRPRNRQRKRKVFLFFLIVFLDAFVVEIVFSGSRLSFLERGLFYLLLQTNLVLILQSWQISCEFMSRVRSSSYILL